jgi:hypothetical protein
MILRQGRFLMVLFAVWIAWAGFKRLSVSESIVQRKPQSVQPQAEDCSPIDMARKVISGKKLPKAFLYRYANQNEAQQFKRVMTATEHEHKMTQTDWNRMVIGENNRLKTKAFRQGLFAAETPEDIEGFATPNFETLLRIEIRFECLFAGKVESFLLMPSNPRFKQWYLSKERSLSLVQWFEKCYDSDGRPMSKEIDFYATAKNEQSECESTLDEFWNENQIKMIHDPLINRGWLIRDPNCIADVKTPDLYLGKLGMADAGIWNNTCDLYRDHRLMTKLWLRAFSDSMISVQKLDELKNYSLADTTKNIYPPMTSSNPAFNVQDFAQSFDQAIERCVDKKQNQGAINKLKQIEQMLSGIEPGQSELTSQNLKLILDQLCN